MDGTSPGLEVFSVVRGQSGGRVESPPAPTPKGGREVAMTHWNNGGVAVRALTIEIGRSGDSYTLTLHGILDLSTSQRLEAAIDAALDSDVDRVVVDLDGLEFVDSTGLATILGVTRRANGNGRLRMTRGTGEVAQLFRLTALDLVLPFE
jgi:anti-sigma B factor antagonist